MKTVHLAPALTFPAAELATEVVASLGQRGGGKSNGAGVIAEGLLAANIQVIVLDHVGIWFSLRLDASGKHSSPYQIPVLGGQHGDIALVSTTGKVVAEALAQSGSSAVLDVSRFGKMERCRFAADFAEAFFAAKQLYPGPVQILLEEAQRYVPQKLFSGQGLERMLGAFEEIAEVGRNYGIGLHLISQRPQKINKDVLNLADTVLAYRTNGVLERKAIGEWVQEKGAEGRKEVHDELPGLPRGSAIVWSPNRDCYGQFAIKLKSTYDAGATPTHARAAVKTKRLDLASLESAMGAAVEEAKANDPRALKAEIAELKKKLAGAGKNVSAGAAIHNVKASAAQEERATRAALVAVQRVERLAEKLDKQEKKFDHDVASAVKVMRLLVDNLDTQRDRLAQAQQAVVSEIGNLQTTLTGAASGTLTTGAAATHGNGTNGIRGNAPGRRTDDALRVPPTVKTGISYSTGAAAGPSLKISAAGTVPVDDLGPLSSYERDLLVVVARRGEATDSEIAVLSRYSKNSSAFGKNLNKLVARGLIANNARGVRVITEYGRATAGDVGETPTGRALLEHWCERLTSYETQFLRTIHDALTISRPELAEKTGKSITSSAFGKTIGALARLKLIAAEPSGRLTISPDLLDG